MLKLTYIIRLHYVTWRDMHYTSIYWWFMLCARTRKHLIRHLVESVLYLNCFLVPILHKSSRIARHAAYNFLPSLQPVPAMVHITQKAWPLPQRRHMGHHPTHTQTHLNQTWVERSGPGSTVANHASDRHTLHLATSTDILFPWQALPLLFSPLCKLLLSEKMTGCQQA